MSLHDAVRVTLPLRDDDPKRYEKLDELLNMATRYILTGKR